MSKLIILVGLPGSGKSTCAQKLMSENPGFHLLSSDEYRKMLLGNETDQSNNQLVFETLYKDMASLLRSDKDVIFDATNINRHARAQAIQIGKRYQAIIRAHVMAPPLEEVLLRDQSRDRTVGKDVIYKFLTKFELPQFFEGFDEVTIDDYREGEYYRIYFDKMRNFDQENPHHNLPLDQHCWTATEIAENFDLPECVIDSLRFHDAGKVYVKTKGEDGYSHYYGHAYVSAYLAVSSGYCIEKEHFLDTILLINYHMIAHDFSNPQVVKRWEKRLGAKKIEWLRAHAFCDQKAQDRICQYDE